MRCDPIREGIRERGRPACAATCDDGSSGSVGGDGMTAGIRAGRGDALPRPAPAPGVPLGVIISEHVFLSIAVCAESAGDELTPG